jgi:hypothetical protein
VATVLLTLLENLKSSSLGSRRSNPVVTEHQEYSSRFGLALSQARPKPLVPV